MTQERGMSVLTRGIEFHSIQWLSCQPVPQIGRSNLNSNVFLTMMIFTKRLANSNITGNSSRQIWFFLLRSEVYCWNERLFCRNALRHNNNFCCSKCTTQVVGYCKGYWIITCHTKAVCWILPVVVFNAIVVKVPTSVT